METDWELFYIGQQFYGKTYGNRHRKKRRAVLSKGGKCIRCGYSTCLDALDFHHVDPADKEMAWCKMRTRKEETIQEELKKCICVCNRCHREIHLIIGLVDSISRKREKLSDQSQSDYNGTVEPM